MYYVAYTLTYFQLLLNWKQEGTLLDIYNLNFNSGNTFDFLVLILLLFFFTNIVVLRFKVLLTQCIVCLYYCIFLVPRVCSERKIHCLVDCKKFFHIWLVWRWISVISLSEFSFFIYECTYVYCIIYTYSRTIVLHFIQYFVRKNCTFCNMYCEAYIHIYVKE